MLINPDNLANVNKLRCKISALGWQVLTYQFLIGHKGLVSDFTEACVEHEDFF